MLQVKYKYSLYLPFVRRFSITRSDIFIFPIKDYKGSADEAYPWSYFTLSLHIFLHILWRYIFFFSDSLSDNFLIAKLRQ